MAKMVKIERMTEAHLEEAYKIEIESFATPWTKEDFKHDIVQNTLSYYLAAVKNGVPIGYAGMWRVVNEGHITNIAVAGKERGRGVGTLLLDALIKEARKKKMIGLTLEVRIGGEVAQRLYTKFGFKPEGLRKNYYTDTKEDAVIMWKYFDNYATLEKRS